MNSDKGEKISGNDEEDMQMIISDYGRNYLPPTILVNYAVSSNTIEWISSHSPNENNNKDYISFSHGNELIIAALDLPESCNSPDYNDQILKVEKRIKNEAIILKARSEPKSPWIVATQTVSKDILIFDCNQHHAEPGPDVDPLIRVKGHKSGGAALSWNNLAEGTLLSGSMDKKIMMWNFNPFSCTVVGKVEEFSEHNGTVTGVEWMPFECYLFGSVDDNKYLMLWDLRKGPTPVHNFVAHTDAVTSLSFNPLAHHLLATASLDETAAIWDLRQLKERYLKVHGVVGHAAEITGIKWSPNSKSVFAVIGANGKTHLFNLFKSTMESYSSAEHSLQRDSMFIHDGGHGRLNDISWHPRKPGLLASVSATNFSAWQIPNVVWEHIETGINNVSAAKQFQNLFGWNYRETFEI